MSWTYLDLLYRFGRRINGDDYANICLAVAKWTLLWQPVKYGRCLQIKCTVEWRLLFASAFNNGLADRKSAFKSFSGNNQATLCPHLVNFRPTISEFSLLKRTIFAVIRPQFDDDLHLSHCSSKTYWKITIHFSIVIGSHFCISCRNLVRFGSVTPEFNPYVAIGGYFTPQTHFLSCCSETARNCDKGFCDFSWIYVG